MPSADAISVTYRDGEYSVQYPEWTQAVDLFDHPNVFIAEVDNPDLELSLIHISIVGPGTFRTVMEPTAGADSTPNTVFIASCTGYVPSCRKYGMRNSLAVLCIQPVS